MLSAFLYFLCIYFLFSVQFIIPLTSDHITYFLSFGFLIPYSTFFVNHLLCFSLDNSSSTLLFPTFLNFLSMFFFHDPYLTSMKNHYSLNCLIYAYLTLYGYIFWSQKTLSCFASFHYFPFYLRFFATFIIYE